MHVKNFLSPTMCLLTRVFYWKNPQNGHKSYIYMEQKSVQFKWHNNKWAKDKLNFKDYQYVNLRTAKNDQNLI